MNKQTIQYLLLGVLLVGLLVAVYYTLQTPTPAKPKPVAAKPEQINVATATVAATVPGLDWAVADGAEIIKELKRDPFVGSVGKPAVVAAVTPPVEPPVKTPWGGNSVKLRPDSGSQEIEWVKSEPRKLNWIDIATATKALVNLKTVLVSEENRKIVLEGPAADVDKAQETLTALDVEPPVPDFGLRGIIMTEARPMAFGLYNGQYYQVVKGQAIPGSGWSVTNISEKGFTVTDGRRTKQIQAGGSK